MKLVLAEKPSVAQSIAKVLGATKREDGYLEGNGYVVSWCVGHLVELSQPEAYDEKYNKWAYVRGFLKPVAGLRCRHTPVWLFPFQGGIAWHRTTKQSKHPKQIRQARSA